MKETTRPTKPATLNVVPIMLASPINNKKAKALLIVKPSPFNPYNKIEINKTKPYEIIKHFI